MAATVLGIRLSSSESALVFGAGMAVHLRGCCRRQIRSVDSQDRNWPRAAGLARRDRETVCLGADGGDSVLGRGLVVRQPVVQGESGRPECPDAIELHLQLRSTVASVLEAEPSGIGQPGRLLGEIGRSKAVVAGEAYERCSR